MPKGNFNESICIKLISKFYSVKIKYILDYAQKTFKNCSFISSTTKQND